MMEFSPILDKPEMIKKTQMDKQQEKNTQKRISDLNTSNDFVDPVESSFNLRRSFISTEVQPIGTGNEEVQLQPNLNQSKVLLRSSTEKILDFVDVEGTPEEDIQEQEIFVSVFTKKKG